MKLPLLLLLLLYSLASCQTQTPATANTRKIPTPTTPVKSPTTIDASQASTSIDLSTPGNNFTSNVTSPNTDNGLNLISQNATWQGNLLAFLAQLAGSQSQQPTEGSDSQGIAEFLARLPGLLQGLGGVDLSGNDVASVLASLLSDPRAAGIPAWIEAMTQTNSSVLESLTLGNVQTLMALVNVSQASATVPQPVLQLLFADVTRGLQSLNMTTDSSLSDVVSAVMADPGLMSSLSSEALRLLGALTGVSNPQALVDQQGPQDPDAQCNADLQTWAAGLQSGDMWALQMLDATGKLQSGLFTGQILLVGDYDQCMDIAYTTNTSHTIQGHMCGMAVSPPPILSAVGPSLGVYLCVPKSCEVDQLTPVLKPILDSLGVNNLGMECYTTKNPEGDGSFIAATVTLGILTVLCAVGTLYGIVVDRQEKRQSEKQPAPTNGFTNHAYATNGEAALIHSNHHVTKQSANGDVPHTHNGDHVTSELPNNYVPYSEEQKVDLKDVETVMINGKNSAGVVVSVDRTASPSLPVKPAPPSPAKPGLGAQLLLSFSVLKNGRKVLNCDQNKSDISCLHGIRVLSITWVILGHCFSSLGTVQGNSTAIVRLLGYIAYMPIAAGVLSVDTFFLMSGCLTAYLFLRSTKKSGLTVSGMVLYYVHRIWRLTPLYAVMLAVYVGIFPYLKDGPYQHAAGMDSETSCRDYWYFNLLYVNNVVDDSLNKMCFGWSWYLSNDMQFYVIAPLVLIPWALKRSARGLEIMGFMVCGAMILTHCITTGVISYDLNASMFVNNQDYMQKIYFVPWCRIGPYAIGLLLGYALFVTKGAYKMDKLSVGLGWLLAWAVGLTLVYVQYDNFDDLANGVKWDASENAAFESLNKVLWACCVSWVVFACANGYGGFVNTLLSWSAWAPLSRLTYGVYLIHLVIIPLFAGNARKPFYMDGWFGTQFFLAVTVLSFLASFVTSMLVEAPTLGLEKAVLGRIFRKKK